MSLFKNIKGFLRFRYKLYYAEVKSLFNQGSFIYSINDQVKFVCNRKDYFSKIIFISEGHEKLEMKWCSEWLHEYPRDAWVIDCGANIGFFSSYLAQSNPTSTVLSIEGNISTFQILQSTIHKLGLHNVAVKNAVLAESKDKLYDVPDTPGREPWQQARESSFSNLATLTLDDIVKTNNRVPELVKIDCEGFEVKILKGANELLKLRSTAFMVECNDFALKQAGTDRVELFNLFRDNHYKLFHLSSFDLKVDLGVEITNDFPSKEFNFAAIPDKEEYITSWNKVLMALGNKGE